MTVPCLRVQSSVRPTERTVTLLGATGSIGTSTIDLLKRESKHYRVEAVTAHRNASALARIARDIGARYAAVADPNSYRELKDALAGSGKWTIEIINRSQSVATFKAEPKRWVIERTFAWFGRNRRLAKDFEATIESAEAWVMIASVRLLVRRLARA